jgi:hypothetical protein
MRVLFVGINIEYSNPSKALMLPLLKGAFQTDFYGLGFVSSSEIESGILKFYEAKGPYDLVIWDNYISFYHSKEKFLQILVDHLTQGSNNFCFDKNLIPEFINDLYESLRTLEPKVIHSFLQTDLYHFDKDFTDYLSQTGHYYMLAGGEVPVLKEKNPSLVKEGFFERVRNNWHYFAQEHSSRLIPIPHWLAETEFSWTPLSERKYLATVPGTGYYRRKKAASLLKASGVKQPSYLIPKLCQFANRHFFSRFNVNDPFMKIRYLNFMQAISNTRYAYTDGSYLDYSVRKFFEIPALGTVLMCSPSIAYENFGFKHSVNSVVVEPAEFLDAIKGLEDDPLRAQRIADEGRQLIFEKHSLSARSNDLRRSLEAIQCGNYNGADWRDGELTLRNPV